MEPGSSRANQALASTLFPLLKGAACVGGPFFVSVGQIRTLRCKFLTVCMILQVIYEYDKDLKSKHAGQRVAVWPILGVPQNRPSKIIQTVAIFRILLTVCMILGIFEAQNVMDGVDLRGIPGSSKQAYR